MARPWADKACFSREKLAGFTIRGHFDLGQRMLSREPQLSPAKGSKMAQDIATMIALVCAPVVFVGLLFLFLTTPSSEGAEVALEHGCPKSVARCVAAPLPLKILYFVLAYVLAFGLIAAITGFEFGRDAAGKVVIFAQDIATMIALLCAPVVLVGFLFLFLTTRSSEGAEVALEHGCPKSVAWFVAAPLPFKILYFVLAYVLAFGLIAAITGFEFGRDAAGKVVIFAQDFAAIIGIICAPVVLVGVFYLIARRADLTRA